MQKVLTFCKKISKQGDRKLIGIPADVAKYVEVGRTYQVVLSQIGSVITPIDRATATLAEAFP